MPTLTAEENRYLLRAEPGERARVRRIPAVRWAPERHAYALPLRNGVILALDRVFGPGGWTAEGRAASIAADARQQQPEPPRGKARVQLDGSQLAVQCEIADRELVKLVPGYRWSPGNRTWYVPAVPLALEILEEYFGEALLVDDEARRVLDLRALDERAAIEQERASRERELQRVEEPPAAPEPVATALPLPPAELAPEPATEQPASLAAESPASDAIVERLDRIEATLGRLETLFARVADALTAPPVAAAPAAPAAEAPGARSLPDDEPFETPLADWQAILDRASGDPAGALDDANRAIQTSSGAEVRNLRAVAGIAAHGAGKLQLAFEHLSEALGRTAALDDAALQRGARDSYRDLVFRFLNDDTGPAKRIDSVETLRGLLLAELQDGSGFDKATVGSPAARATLERLVADPALRAISPDLSDFCRVAHLVSIVRGGGRMAASLVAGVLREDTLHPDARALAIILYQNVLSGSDNVDDWINAWPQEPEDETAAPDAAGLVAATLAALPGVSSDLVRPMALAALAISVRSDDVSLNDRRRLLNQIPPGEDGRGYAEFLAVYRLAESGERTTWGQFPGYVRVVGGERLERSWPYLHEVFVNSTGGEGAARPLADGAYLPALTTWGITDPQTQLIDLLDLLDAGNKPDNLLNELAALVEDRGFRGADLLSTGQRLEVYRRAFRTSVRMGHNVDGRIAFDRLVRALADQPGGELIALCREHLAGWRPLRVPAAITLAETLLGEGAPIADVLDLFVPFVSGVPDDDTEEVLEELAALADLGPDYRAAVDAFVAKYNRHYHRDSDRTFENRRVVIVGGRESQRKHGLKLFAEWKLDVDWLDSEEAKRGARLGALIAGSCDLVVVNTAHIGHASSGRAEDAAKAASKPVVYNASNGIGRLRRVLWDELMKLDTTKSPATGKTPRKVSALKGKYGL
ncbi:MAG: DUF2325 domain-containing protein [Hyphomicrobiales bacterium]